jgi:DNA adenine methylase
MAASKGKLMLSINDHPDIREVFQAFPRLDIGLRYSVGGGRTDTPESRELVITNWDIHCSGGLF